MSIRDKLLAGLLGGVQVPHCKHTAECKTIAMPAPKRITLPMQQHLGAPCQPTVKVGDSVAVGQCVADCDHPLSAPIHSGVSGTVAAISDILMPGGQKCQAIVIDSDGEQRIHDSVRPPEANTFEEFIHAVRASGLVGLGGAGFPAHVKLRPKNIAEIDTIVVNAAECEPYITSDYRECMENPWDIVYGAKVVMEFMDAARVVIAIEKNKPAAISELQKISKEVTSPGREIMVKELPSRYPQGAEKVLIASCTGRRVPPGKLPADVGCIVMNVASVAFLHRYLQTGMPLIEKRLTVDGSAVAEPKNVCVTIGTPVSEVLAFCGGTQGEVRKLLMGGPMMGLALMDDAIPVLKQNNAILALAEKDVLFRSETACIRCGRCVRACPIFLQPLSIEAAYKAHDSRAMEQLNVMACMECGCCSYVCPAARHLVQTMRLAKGDVRKAHAAAK